MGDSRYVLEPNVKDGKGGLRDLQTLYWIAKYLYRVEDVGALVEQGVLTRAEVSGFEKARLFLLTLRCHLHAVAGRAEDRLTFDLQPEVGRRMGYTDHAGTRGVERVMKHYFLVAKEVGDLTRILCAALEAAQRRRPKILGGFAWLRRKHRRLRGRGRTAGGARPRALRQGAGQDPEALPRRRSATSSTSIPLRCRR